MRRWNGWGDERIEYALPSAALPFLTKKIGASAPPVDAQINAALAQIPESRLPLHSRINSEPMTRLCHSFGQSLPDWLRLRFGRLGRVTDGVWRIECEEDIAQALHYAAQHKVRVLVYGGGTSVVGHFNIDDVIEPVLTLAFADYGKLRELRAGDRLALFDAGVSGPLLEAQLRAHGFTLGHFPQSFEYATLGGWIATRSSGQQSRRYGRIEQLFAGGAVITDSQRLHIAPFPASAAGPDLREWLLGSEGRMGVISQAWVRISPVPEQEKFYAIFFPDWSKAREASRAIAQSDISFSMLRLSNATETETQLALAGHERLIRHLHRYLAWRGCGENKCMMLIGFSGSAHQVKAQHRLAQKLFRAFGACSTGTIIGSKWAKNRFRHVYLRNALWQQGYAIDTVETACHWSQVDHMVTAIESAAKNVFASKGEQVHAYTHLSHVYCTGSSVYSTFVFRLAPSYEENLARWQTLKAAVSAAIQAQGGTISHQHGVGKDHKPWLASEKSDLGLKMLAAAFAQSDPNAMMNTGNLLD